MPETFSPSQEPVLGWSSSTRATVERVTFGDGYTQRARPGLNSLRRELEFEWKGAPKSVADAIDAFLRARGGAEAFLYTPPGWSGPVLFTCAEWRATEIGRDAVTLNAKFVEEFDLG